MSGPPSLLRQQGKLAASTTLVVFAALVVIRLVVARPTAEYARTVIQIGQVGPEAKLDPAHLALEKLRRHSRGAEADRPTRLHRAQEVSLEHGTLELIAEGPTAAAAGAHLEAAVGTLVAEHAPVFERRLAEETARLRELRAGLQAARAGGRGMDVAGYARLAEMEAELAARISPQRSWPTRVVTRSAPHSPPRRELRTGTYLLLALLFSGVASLLVVGAADAWAGISRQRGRAA